MFVSPYLGGIDMKSRKLGPMGPGESDWLDDCLESVAVKLSHVLPEPKEYRGPKGPGAPHYMRIKNELEALIFAIAWTLALYGLLR
jgi:hypothetical protein